MKSIVVTFLTFILLFISVDVNCQNENKRYIDGELLVQLNDPSGIDRILSDYKAFDLVNKHTVSKRFNIFLLGFNESLTSNQSIVQAIQRERSVVHIQNNHYIKLRDGNETSPNDSLFGDQWSMDNIGQGGGQLDADIDATDAWDITTGGLTANGDTIVVAIIDGGSDIYHEDIDHWVNYHEVPGNGIDDDSNGYIDDRHGWNVYEHNGTIPFNNHGVHVAGIVGAKGNNEIGVSGVNWNVKILPVAGSSTFESTVVEALSYVYVVREQYDQTNGQKGAFVVADNCSFGVDEGNPEDFPIWEAMYDSLGKLGILSIAATANRNWDIDVKGDVPTAFATSYMISVTNTTNKDKRNTGAAYGDTTIDLGSPGTSIKSTLISNNYGNKSGTSMATPHVAGSVALLMAAADSAFISAYKNNPGESILQIREYILNGVDSLEDLQGKTVTGGRLNVFTAINLLLDAPALSVDKDSVYVELPLNSETFDSLVLSNTGGDTINYTISIEGDPDWLELSQYEGNLPSLQWDEITLTFYSDGLDTGIYQTNLEISADNISTRYVPVTMYVYDNVGLDDQQEYNTTVNVFPNPFSSQVSITIGGEMGGQYMIEIFDQYGKRAYGKQVKLNKSSCSIIWQGARPGIYFYRISENNKSVSSGKLVRF